MAESEEEPPPKQLVRAANGDLWLVRKGANPEKKHSKQRDLLPQDSALVQILEDTNIALANHFGSANPGVKVGITVVDFDDQY